MSETMTLVIANGALRGFQRVFHLPRQVIIGRGEDCDIRLPNLQEFMGVSRHHCLLRMDSNGVRVRDLESRNGTYVNGVLVGDAGPASEDTDTNGVVWRSLKPGDELRVAGTYLQLREESDTNGLNEEEAEVTMHS